MSNFGPSGPELVGYLIIFAIIFIALGVLIALGFQWLWPILISWLHEVTA
ncbi:hypothetical protein V3390_09435 [Luteimonas sp. FXH3W]|uniref:Uncharacterized protein n=1 Tax=Aquilutibacter rugosus TaxID=3115820 RepID=A0ABU7V3N2_9GAMM